MNASSRSPPRVLMCTKSPRNKSRFRCVAAHRSSIPRPGGKLEALPLVAVLAILVLLTVIVAAFLSKSRFATRASGNFSAGAAADRPQPRRGQYDHRQPAGGDGGQIGRQDRRKRHRLSARSSRRTSCGARRGCKSGGGKRRPESSPIQCLIERDRNRRAGPRRARAPEIAVECPVVADVRAECFRAGAQVDLCRPKRGRSQWAARPFRRR